MSDRGEEQPDDRTRPLPPPAGDPDDTAVLGGTPPEGTEADATAVVPPTQRPQLWSGRAEVRPPGPGDDRELAPGEWYGDEQAGRRWWLPILWGIVLLLLLGALGVGLWLARQAVDEDDSSPPSPQPTSTAPTSASASPTRSPSAAPTTSAAPTGLPLPPLVGLSEDAARARLEALDLEPEVVYRPSDQPAGTVIATDPGQGEPVQPGDVVRLVVATPSPSTTAPTTAPTTTDPTTTGPTTEPTATASPTG